MLVRALSLSAIWFVLSLIRLLASSTELPRYVRFLPVDISSQQLIGHERKDGWNCRRDSNYPMMKSKSEIRIL
jgi:hypothetical protein